MIEIKKSRESKRIAEAFEQKAQRHVGIVQLYAAEVASVSTINKLFFYKQHNINKHDFALFEENLNKSDIAIPESSYTQFVDKRGKLCSPQYTALGAFLHFSYQHTNQTMVLDDLGGVQTFNGGFLLKTPTIHSKSEEYGADDLGEEGIKQALANHSCSELCKIIELPEITR